MILEDFWKIFFSELSEHGLTEVVKVVVKAQKLTCWKVSIVTFTHPIFLFKISYLTIAGLKVQSLNDHKGRGKRV